MRLIVVRKMSINTVLLMLSLLCVSTYAFLEHTSIAIAAFSSVKQPLLIMGAVCLVPLIGIFFPKLNRKGYLMTFTALFVLLVILFAVMMATKDLTYSDSVVRNTFRLMLYLVDLFVLMVTAAEMGEGQRVLRFLLRYVLILMVVSDLLMFTGLASFKSGRHDAYLVGSKFSVSYLHMNFLALWALNQKKTLRSYRIPLWKVLFAAAYIVAVAIRTDCMTGILGCVMLIALFMIIESPRRDRFLRFSSPWMLLLFLVGSVVFAFAAEVIMQLPFMKFIVENIFGRDASITGRTTIYYLYISTIPEHWLTGYGFGSANAVTSALFGYDNVQNALLQWVLQIGVIGTLGLVALMMTIFKQITWKNAKNMPKILILIALIYMYVILGAIETSFNMSFLLWFGLIFMLTNEKTPQRRRVM